MRTNKYAEPEGGEAFVYVRDALKEQCEIYNIRRHAIMVLFKQSNPATASRWLDGEDIYINCLLKIINKYELNPLDFFEYKGHRFRTRLEDLARIEEAGIDVGSLIAGVGIKLPAEKTVPSQEPVTKAERQLIETQQELIEAQKEIISNLRSELNKMKENCQQPPIRMVADNTPVTNCPPIV